MIKEVCVGYQFSDLINHQSGLLGISETSSDMRELLKRKQEDPRASDAIDFFVIKQQNGLVHLLLFWLALIPWCFPVVLGNIRRKFEVNI